jgi:ABC-2 type transport system ATP-binding protein/lipopolysaccharide transport system ATP-binding protein
VGTGFHLELTGRENVFLNGSILGMSRRDIAARFDSIVDFAGVERFIDTPVKRYSSGMYLRLAFAVAAHVEPDVLIVDEVLAVGDAEFQRKCLDGMSTAEAEGRTLVFVSHDLDAIARLCRRALWLDQGRLRLDGPTGEVLDAYLRSGRDGPGGGRVGEPAGGASGGPGPAAMADPAGRVVVHSISVVDGAGRAVGILRRDGAFAVEIDLTLAERVPGFDLALYLVNRRGVRVLDEAWSDTEPVRLDGPGRHVVRVTVPPVLNVGDYAIGLWVGSGDQEIMDVHAAHGFTIEGSARGRPDRVVELLLPWEVRPATGNGHPGRVERSGVT